MLKFYWYPNCSTCRKARKALQLAGIPFQAIDITISPPTEKQFKSWLQSGQAELKGFFNTSGEEYRKAGGASLLKSRSESELIAMLTKNGRLVKRPILADGNKATFGFRDAEAILKAWS